MTPIAVRVSGHEGTGARIFVRGQATRSAWLYALQAAKTSVTVWGIWIGHVYHWHIVTAAMQMTMFNTVSDDHPIYQLLAPQSDYLIPFDTRRGADDGQAVAVEHRNLIGRRGSRKREDEAGEHRRARGPAA